MPGLGDTYVQPAIDSITAMLGGKHVKAAPSPPPIQTGKTRESDNHLYQLEVIYYLRTGDASRLIPLLNRLPVDGLCLNEGPESDSHHSHWTAAIDGALLGAQYFGHADVLAAVMPWECGFRALERLCSCPNGKYRGMMTMPGARCHLVSAGDQRIPRMRRYGVQDGRPQHFPPTFLAAPGDDAGSWIWIHLDAAAKSGAKWASGWPDLRQRIVTAAQLPPLATGLEVTIGMAGHVARLLSTDGVHLASTWAALDWSTGIESFGVDPKLGDFAPVPLTAGGPPPAVPGGGQARKVTIPPLRASAPH